MQLMMNPGSQRSSKGWTVLVSLFFLYFFPLRPFSQLHYFLNREGTKEEMKESSSQASLNLFSSSLFIFLAVPGPQGQESNGQEGKVRGRASSLAPRFPSFLFPLSHIKERKRS